LVTALDTNILSLLWSGSPVAKSMQQLLIACYRDGALVVSAPVFAELCANPAAGVGFVESRLKLDGIAVDYAMPAGVWRLTGEAFAAYSERRRRSGGGVPKRLLTDFMIGAHAQVCADRLATLDQRRYRAAFPDLPLLP
jgi:predicted nucleic acid-binding protein